MILLAFLFGLLLGLIGLIVQRSQMNKKLKRVLREISQDAEEELPFSSTAQLALAVSQQQRLLHQYEHQLEVYRQVLNASPVGYLQVDEENRLVWVNAQARSLLGITQFPEPNTRLLLELVRSYELDQLLEETRDMQRPRQADWIFYPVSPDPSLLSRQQGYALRGYGIPLLRNHVGVFLENRQEAISLMQQRDRWASDVAHELKTPLTSIRLVAETLQSRLDPPLRGWVDRLANEAVRLSNLVQDMLDLAQLDQDAAHHLQVRSVDLPELVQSAWANLEPLARKKQLRLDYLGPEHLRLQIDEARIYRVLINLLDNAIKFSPPWQHIQVRIGLQEPEQPEVPAMICLEVIDAGPGFPESALPCVFERFYRADPSRSRLEVGQGAIAETATSEGLEISETDQASLRRTSTGLGLAIVRQIVEAHHGTVAAANHLETGGAWLKVWLPQRQPELIPLK